jgi:hypothetical protein
MPPLQDIIISVGVNPYKVIKESLLWTNRFPFV